MVGTLWSGMATQNSVKIKAFEIVWERHKLFSFMRKAPEAILKHKDHFYLPPPISPKVQVVPSSGAKIAVFILLPKNVACSLHALRNFV